MTDHVTFWDRLLAFVLVVTATGACLVAGVFAVQRLLCICQ